MICPDCQASEAACLLCDGTGNLCDVCGESAESGADICHECQRALDDIHSD